LAALTGTALTTRAILPVALRSAGTTTGAAFATTTAGATLLSTTLTTGATRTPATRRTLAVATRAAGTTTFAALRAQFIGRDLAVAVFVKFL
jgi:hypothetical protein